MKLFRARIAGVLAVAGVILIGAAGCAYDDYGDDYGRGDYGRHGRWDNDGHRGGRDNDRGGRGDRGRGDHDGRNGRGDGDGRGRGGYGRHHG